MAEILLAPEGLCSVKLVHMYLLEKHALINKLQESRSLDFNLLLKLIKLAAELSLSLFSYTPVEGEGIFTSSVTNTNGKVHSSGVSNFLMRFMRIFHAFTSNYCRNESISTVSWTNSSCT